MKDRKWRILASGPVRSIAELEYDGWNAAGRIIHLQSRITMWAGERGFEHVISADCGDNFTFVTGLPSKPGISPVNSEKSSRVTWISTWGQQVVAPKLQERAKDKSWPYSSHRAPRSAFEVTLGLRHSVEQGGSAAWYATIAAWDQGIRH